MKVNRTAFSPSILLLSQIFLNLIIIAQQPTQEWVRRYNWNNFSSGFSVQLDSSNNVYVLMKLSNPTTSGDYGLAKYSPSGNLLWSVNYNSPGNLNDFPTAFVVTNTGEAYITGFFDDPNFFTHILTVKYSSSGSLLWSKIYDGGGVGDAPNDIKIDNSGNIIIGGGTLLPGNDTAKALIIKYNPNGNLIWSRNFNQLPDQSYIERVILDDSNNIYTVGSHGHYLNLPDFLILKYNSSGNLQWFTTYNTPENSQDHAYFIAMDSLGNIYVVGTTQVFAGAGTNNILLKMNNIGAVQWVRVFRGIISGNGNGGYVLSGLAVSADNNSVYFTTGCPSAQANEEIVTVKYTTLGDSVWTKRYFGGVNGATNRPSALKLDKDNNIYVTGIGNHPVSGDDFVTIKYLPNGTQHWVTTYNGPLSGSFDYSNDIAIDNDYSIYVTGTSSYANDLLISWETATIKYSQIIGIFPNSNELPVKFRLFQNYPNPFNSTTVVSYALPRRARIELNIYNSLGQLIKGLVNGEQQSSYYTIVLDTRDLASGIYFYSLMADNTLIETKKLILLK